MQKYKYGLFIYSAFLNAKVAPQNYFRLFAEGDIELLQLFYNFKLLYCRIFQ